MESSLTMYDMVKQILANKEPISDKAARQELKKIAKAMKNNPDSIYFMICPDLRQYVVFEVYYDEPNTDNILKTLIEVLDNRGTIIDIDSSAADQEIWEIWLRDKYDEKIYMYQLTNYDDNVIIVGKEDNR